MPRLLHWFLRFSILNPICTRLIGAASRRRRDLYIRSGYIAILGVVLLLGLLSLTATGRFSLRDLAAGSSSVFGVVAITQLILICVLTPMFMAGAISKEAKPRTWDILLTTPLSPLQIILGNLFGRLFFIIALLIGTLPIMIVTQFFGGVSLDTIIQVQIISAALALIVATAAIGMSVTRTAGRKAAVSFFVVTVLYLLLTLAIDRFLRTPVTAGSTSSWTTLITPLNPFLVLEALLQPSGYVIPKTSNLFWPLSSFVTNPVSSWIWVTCLLSFFVIAFSANQVRKMGDRCNSNILGISKLSKATERKGHAVSGNPIAWRERVTRHRHFGSIIARWGFVALCLLAFIILTTLFLTNMIPEDMYQILLLFLLLSEIIIVTFTSISLAASSIAKEREDGSLDLLLTTAITPKLYLSGKIRGLTMHLLPMVLVPCCTMVMLGSLTALLPDSYSITANTDILPSTTKDLHLPETPMPIIFFLPALLFPIVFIPYIAFCITLGLLWSMRSRATITAIITTLFFVCVITIGLGLCLIPFQGINFAGAISNSISPINNLFAIFEITSQKNHIKMTMFAANIQLGIGSFIAGAIWSSASAGLLRAMSASFVVTVRRLAGNA